jgi:hypothetical protein
MIPIFNRFNQTKINLLSFFIWGCGVCFFYALIAGGISFWDAPEDPLSHTIPRYHIICFAIVLLGLGITNYFLIENRQKTLIKQKRLLKKSWTVPLAALLIIFFIGDFLTRKYVLFPGPTIRGEIILGMILSWALTRGSPSLYQIRFWTIGTALLAFIQLLLQTKGKPIFTDDHATFYLRLSLLIEQFPSVPFFYPLWNGGIDARDFFATGSLGVFLLFAPLFYLIPLNLIYTPIVSSIPFIIAPLSTFWSAKLLGYSQRSALVSALLALSPSFLWPKWYLAYGTLGFLLSCSLFPLCATFLLRFADKRLTISWPEAIICSLVTSIALMWSPTGLALLPLLAWCALKIPQWYQSRVHLSIVCLTTAITVPWVLLFITSSPIFSFISQATQRGSAEIHAEHQTRTSPVTVASIKQKIKRIITQNGNAINPILAVCGTLGFLLTNRKNFCIFFILPLWLLSVGILGPLLKPQLELDRLLLFLALLGTVPAGHLIDKIWRLKALQKTLQFKKTNLTIFIITIILGGFFFSTPFVLSAISRNRSLEQSTTLDKEVENLASAIASGAQQGRGLFTGFVLHELSGGHLAPLTLLSGTPLIAHSWAHNMWRYNDVIPDSFQLEGIKGLKDYLNKMNVGVVIAHERKWKSLLKDNPDDFLPIYKGRWFTAFKRTSFTSNYFLEGQGVVLEQNTSSVRIRIDSTDGILKFSYFPFLMLEGCQILPVIIHSGTGGTMIRYKNCTKGKETILRSVAPFNRFMKVLGNSL